MKPLVPAILIALMSTSCVFEPEACAVDEDCPAGSYCGIRDGVCLVADPAVPDAGDFVADSSVGADSGEFDAYVSASDLGTVRLSCDFTEDCDGSAPGDETHGLVNDDPVGCPRTEFVGLEKRYTGLACGNEPNSWDLRYVRCADETFEIEAVLRTGAECVSRFELTFMPEDGGPYVCGSNGVVCEIRGDGTHIVRLTVPASAFPTGVETLTVEVTSQKAYPLGYVLDIAVRR